MPANVVERRLMPQLGIALLGWLPEKVFIVYCADTIASPLLMMLVCDRVLGINAGARRRRRGEPSAQTVGGGTAAPRKERRRTHDFRRG